MLLKKFKKVFYGAAALSAFSLGGLYYYHTTYNTFPPYIQNVKILQQNSTIIAQSNSQIAKYSGQYLTSSIPHDLIPEIDQDTTKFSFNLDLWRGRYNENNEVFAELLVNCVKKDVIWRINSIDIKFKNFNSKWFKLFDVIQYDDEGLNTNMNSLQINNILNSDLITNSDELLNVLSKQEPFIIKAIELLIKNNERLNYLGPPITILSISLTKNDFVGKEGKMLVEGKKNSGEVLFIVDKKPNDNYELKSMGIMYKLIEEYMIAESELSKKYQNDILKSFSKQPEWLSPLSEIDLAKIVDEKIVKSNRTLSIIGRPIRFVSEINCVSPNCEKAEVKINANGRLNNGELIIHLNKDSKSEKWQISKSEFKIIWNTNHE
ncbi:unnamed protein product [Brachionus calyciflorus]|uniref:Uncharacterized protein n=1 Tax=Brachionus calyciflorus TaxID=104777 RepID=A0A813PD60_9BILA|nr:unnamed protein product [Brachionus calyciflorus]